MLRTRVIPVLLLKGEGLVKTLKFKNPRYVGDPIIAVKVFNDKEVDEIIILDISATNEGRPPNFRKIREIAGECFMPLAYGGGIRTLDEVKQLFDIGIEKVVINSGVHTNPELLREAAHVFGSQSIVVAIDVEKSLLGTYTVKSHSGTVRQEVALASLMREVEKLGAGEVLVNAIDRDGTMKGFDLALVRLACQSVALPVIACGGAGGIEDLADAIHRGGASAVAAGAMFVFQGIHRAVLISYPDRAALEKMLV
jgi:cyclase